jgi:2-polyprenyl-3-methyl-5-hydroxy-6-metoxy-1,4-benzoquinol methylase
MYDLLAPHYRRISEMRAAYLNAIDRLILSRTQPGARSMLDVGAGDGVRAMRLAKAHGISTVVLVEPSVAMAELCRASQATQVLQVKAEEMPATAPSFDVVTCLWNVLGHIATPSLRLEALRRMRDGLVPRGQIFMDVNNRYNAPSYGWLRSFGRLAYDLLNPADENGDVEFVWRIAEQAISGRGHVFTPREMQQLIADAGLCIQRRYVIDYQTGKQRRFYFAGQLLYELAKR